MRNKKGEISREVLLVFLLVIIFAVVAFMFVTQTGGAQLGLANRITCELTGECPAQFEIDNQVFLRTETGEEELSWYFIESEDYDGRGRPELVVLRANGGAGVYSVDQERWYSVGGEFSTRDRWKHIVTGPRNTEQFFEFASVTNANLQLEYFAELIDFEDPFVGSHHIEIPSRFIMDEYRAIAFGDFFTDPDYCLEDCQFAPIPELAVIAKNKAIKFVQQNSIQTNLVGECQIDLQSFEPFDAQSLDYNADGMADLAVIGVTTGNNMNVILFNHSTIADSCRGMTSSLLPDPKINLDHWGGFEGARAISTGDFNFDDRDDLAVLYKDRIEIRYLPTFTVIQTIDYPEDFWTDLTVADIVDDKNLEVIIVGKLGKIKGYTITL